MVIKGILVSALAPFENHIANGGEKLLAMRLQLKKKTRWTYIFQVRCSAMFFSANFSSEFS